MLQVMGMCILGLLPYHSLSALLVTFFPHLSLLSANLLNTFDIFRPIITNYSMLPYVHD